MSTKTPILVHGYSGRMGQMVMDELAKHADMTFAGGISSKGSIAQNGSALQADQNSQLNLLENSDGVIDFSLPVAADTLLDLATKTTSKSFLICTTGLSEDVVSRWQEIAQAQKHRIMLAPNTSLGIAMFRKVLDQFGKTLRKYGFDAEVIETHHRYKKDAPSGTALFLAESLKESDTEFVNGYQNERKENQVGVHAVRGGGVYGEHEVRFISDYEELSFSHRALDRRLFASGALVLMSWLQKQSFGFYHFKDVDL